MKTAEGGSPTVLIIDDDEPVRISLKLHFEDCGFRVLAVETAEGALELLEEEDVDAAVVDLRLPGLDGIEFIRRASLFRPHLKCVVFTGSPAASVPKEIMEMSTVSGKLFLKPILDLSIITDEVRRMID